MTQAEYEQAIGKIILFKACTTAGHHELADELVESLISEYISRDSDNEL